MRWMTKCDCGRELSSSSLQFSSVNTRSTLEAKSSMLSQQTVSSFENLFGSSSDNVETYSSRDYLVSNYRTKKKFVHDHNRGSRLFTKRGFCREAISGL